MTEKQKHYLLLGGLGIAGAAILYFLLQQQPPTVAPGTITDVPTISPELPSYTDNSPGYSGGNMPPIFPQPLPTQAALDNAAPAGMGACCNKNPCYAGSPLDNGSTYSGPDALSSLLNFYQNTNPNYIKLVAEQNKQYSAMFISSSAYSSAPSLLGITG